MSTHNLCFRAKIRKNVYPCKPQFYYIKVGCKGVVITRACLYDAFFGHKQSISDNAIDKFLSLPCKQHKHQNGVALVVELQQ